MSVRNRNNTGLHIVYVPFWLMPLIAQTIGDDGWLKNESRDG